MVRGEQVMARDLWYSLLMELEDIRTVRGLGLKLRHRGSCAGGGTPASTTASGKASTGGSGWYMQHTERLLRGSSARLLSAPQIAVSGALSSSMRR